MLCNWENNFPDAFRILQPRWVRSRAQMATFRCAADRSATFFLATVYIRTFFDMPQNAENLEKSCIFIVFTKNTAFGMLEFVCVGGGGVSATRSLEICTRPNKFQPAILNTAGYCDHVQISSASAKLQISKGFHVCTSPCQPARQEN